ncbi:hypothetical protein RF11_06397 [Thelohanellus kitauei]|uniref:Uncharacterized protein n=1 Tax=Thelohanellus kitauei TaxID=669202 RepID=A0A0C2JJZ8_THEKT|nr:hypothetical protein RF11_06397 [Thelohanellus kitauei]
MDGLCLDSFGIDLDHEQIKSLFQHYDRMVRSLKLELDFSMCSESNKSLKKSKIYCVYEKISQKYIREDDLARPLITIPSPMTLIPSLPIVNDQAFGEIPWPDIPDYTTSQPNVFHDPETKVQSLTDRFKSWIWG